jgi:hypothetical protein
MLFSRICGHSATEVGGKLIDWVWKLAPERSSKLFKFKGKIQQRFAAFSWFA